MEQKFEKYFDPIHTNIDEECLEMAFRCVKDKILSFDRIKPTTIDKVVNYIDLSKSAGLPYVQGVFKSKRQNVFDARSTSVKILTSYKYNKEYVPKFHPCVTQSRNQLCSIGENKPRLVWAFPFVVTILEMLFVLPFMDTFRGRNMFGWDINWTNKGNDYLKRQCGTTNLFGTDYSSFDSKVTERLIRMAFSIFRQHFVLKDWQNNLLDALVEYFIFTPLIFYGSIKTKKHGIPSGSGFTQIIGSIVNMIIMTYAINRCYKNGDCEPPIEYFFGDLSYDIIYKSAFWLSDDNLIGLNHYYPPGLLVHISRYVAEVNAKIHDVKGFECGYIDYGQSSFLEFLGKKVINFDLVTVDRSLVYSQIVYPENKDRCVGDILTRIIGLAWSSGNDIPILQELKSIYDELTDKYPDAVPTPFTMSQKRMFKYAIFLDYEDISLRFPDISTVVHRYGSDSLDALFL